jgi:hypothetical protein
MQAAVHADAIAIATVFCLEDGVGARCRLLSAASRSPQHNYVIHFITLHRS